MAVALTCVSLCAVACAEEQAPHAPGRGVSTGAEGDAGAALPDPGALDAAALTDAGADAAQLRAVGHYDPEPAELGPSGDSCPDADACDGESCCTTLRVPGGMFLMGRSPGGVDACPSADTLCQQQPDEEPEHEVMISSFYLDKYEVTVGRFRRFVDAWTGPPALGTGAHPGIPESGFPGWLHDSDPPATSAEVAALLDCDDNPDSPTGTLGDVVATFNSSSAVRDALPINCVPWILASAFCIWDGGRLPTEAEWELVAAGAEQNRLYAWGNDPPTDDYAVVDQPGGAGPDVVGSRPDGAARWGHLDLAGNLWEWVWDAYLQDAYERTAPCIDCAILPGGSVRRGGAWFSAPTDVRSTNRGTGGGLPRPDAIGFRCARDA
jgi:formylglycine-generating enzyme required for sulfatase activity